MQLSVELPQIEPLYAFLQEPVRFAGPVGFEIDINGSLSFHTRRTHTVQTVVMSA